MKLRALALCALAALPASLTSASPTLAQVHDGADNPPDEQRIADDFRTKGSACDAPACRNDPEGIYPESTAPGLSSKSPSVPGAGTWHGR